MTYSIKKETEKALLIEFNAYKGAKEELVKLNTWIPKAWTKMENDCRILNNMEKALNEHSEKLRTWMSSRGYGHKGCKFSLKKSAPKKIATQRQVSYYIDASFFLKGENKSDVVEDVSSNTVDSNITNIADIVVSALDGFFYENKSGDFGFTGYKNIEKAKEKGFKILELKDIKVYKRKTKEIKGCYLWTSRTENLFNNRCF